MKYIRTGRASANTSPCKVGYSDRHNKREAKTGDIAVNPNTTIRPELSHNNSTWTAPDIPSLWSHDQAIRKDYAATERTIVMKDGSTRTRKREMPSKGKTAASPIKETILLLPDNSQSTDRMVEEFARQVEQLTGWRCIRRFTHRDERYLDPDTGEQHINNHAHLVWDCYDWQKHDIKKANKNVMRKMQDIASTVTGMERGLDARVTGAEHLSVAEFKNQEERKRAEELKNENIRLQKEVAQMQRDTLLYMKGTAANLLDQYNKLTKVEEPTEKEQEIAISLSTEINKPDSHSEAILRRGIESLAQVIHNITARIIRHARASRRAIAAAAATKKILRLFIPQEAIREIATIKQITAERDQAIRDKDIAEITADNAIEQMEEYRNRALKAEQAKTDAERILNEEHKKGYNEANSKWNKWFESEKPLQKLKRAEKQIEEERAGYKIQISRIANKLISKYNPSELEASGISKEIEPDIWNAAKRAWYQKQTLNTTYNSYDTQEREHRGLRR